MSARLIPCGISVVLLAFGAAVLPVASAPATRPNFLILLADDLGWADVGYHDSEIRTPNLDAMAVAGRRLEQFYVTPQCTPTRVALLTGRFPSRFGPGATHATDRPVLPAGTPTLASILRNHGYHTALAGKWHLGSTFEIGPRHFGFDHSYGSLPGAIGMYDHRQRLGDKLVATWHRNHARLDELGHATDLTADEAVRWISEQVPDQPWLLYVSFNAPHTPLAEGDPRWFTANAHISDPHRQLYAAAVTHLDDAIGRIVAAVQTTGQAGRTVILFFSDNGAPGAHSGDRYVPPDPALPAGYARNTPLRGGKMQVYEGGIRVPAIALGPPPWIAPGQSNAVVHVVDVLPTLLDYAEVPTSAIAGIDGRTMRAVLSGGPVPPVDRTLYWDWHVRNDLRRSAVRHGDWKLVQAGVNASAELYDLGHDLYENNDLASTHPAVAARLLDLLLQERRRDEIAATSLAPGDSLGFDQAADTDTVPR